VKFTWLCRADFDAQEVRPLVDKTVSENRSHELKECYGTSEEFRAWNLDCLADDVLYTLTTNISFYLVGWDLTPIRSLCRSPRFV
jgi:hypothetical protein